MPFVLSLTVPQGWQLNVNSSGSVGADPPSFSVFNSSFLNLFSHFLKLKMYCKGNCWDMMVKPMIGASLTHTLSICLDWNLAALLPI